MSLEQRWNQKGKVVVLSETTDEPLTFAGMMAGICWGADTTDHTKNFKRGVDCYFSGHWRALEYPQIYMILDGWSAKCIREWYTHIIDTTRLQASTRYITYDNFEYVIPKSIEKNEEANNAYVGLMEQRLCSRAYWEIRQLCNEILDALRIYSDEWKWCIDELEMFVPKCVRHLYCSEKYTCGRRPTYSKVAQYIERGKLEEDKVANEAQFDQGD